MIISHSHRAIFVHVPKTAGTTISELFGPALRWNDLILGGTEFGERLLPAYQSRFGLSKHMFARDIRRTIGEETWTAYHSFAFVRHPYTRLLSYYEWCRGAVARAAPDAPLWAWPATQAYLRSASFSDFIRDEGFLASRAGRPQTEWVCDEQGVCIVDFVGRFERLAEDVRTVAARVGLRGAVPGTHNASVRDGAPGERFRSDDYDFLHRVHRRDFDMFGYDPALRL